jgi:hypothetical protein
MSKPKTELGQRCPPPPYTRWDQRGKPVLLSYLKTLPSDTCGCSWRCCLPKGVCRRMAEKSAGTQNPVCVIASCAAASTRQEYRTGTERSATQRAYWRLFLDRILEGLMRKVEREIAEYFQRHGRELPPNPPR